MRMWPARTFVINDPIAESSTPLAPLADFQRVLAGLYPELGGALPDLEQYAESVIVRALNLGAPDLMDAVLEFYGIERVRVVAQVQVNRLDRPAYREWKEKLRLPERTEIVERFHRMWRT